MRALDSLKPTTEDGRRMNFLLEEMGNLIAKSSGDPSLPLDWEYWAQSVFGPVTGYDPSDHEGVPEVWHEVWENSKNGETDC